MVPPFCMTENRILDAWPSAWAEEMPMDTNPIKARIRSDINVTPLVDIVLVLLIVFIVIAPAVNDVVRLPISKHARRVEGKPLTLTLEFIKGISAEHLSITEQGEPAVCLDLKDGVMQLRSLLRRGLAGQKDRPVLIKADATTPFRQLDPLFKLCRDCGATEVSLVTGDDAADSSQGGHS